MLLCLPMPSRRRCASNRGTYASDSRNRPRRHDCECASPRGRCWGQCRNVTAHRGRVLLRALAQAIPERIPAAASGTMNNLTIGGIRSPHRKPFRVLRNNCRRYGGTSTKEGCLRSSLSYDELTEHSGRSARVCLPAASASIFFASGSGGAGQYRGGDGIVREIEILTDADVTLLADRRLRRPDGLSGAAEGAPGYTEIIGTMASPTSCQESAVSRV